MKRSGSFARRLPRALLFDVFGTVVDWHGSVAREARRVGRAHGLRIDGDAFADAWRAAYRPAMDRVRRGAISWRSLDELHRANLVSLLARFGLRLSAREVTELNSVWHRLAPWPDSARGLARLKRNFVIGSLSNGNMALLIDLAKFARLPWDCVLSAELFRHYKPDREVYLGAAKLLALPPREIMLVAAHKDDLAAARRCGFQTAFVKRPLEFGKKAPRDVEPDPKSTFNAGDFIDLATQLGT